MKIKVDSAEVVTKSGNARASGRAYSMRLQTGFWEFNGERRRVEIPLDDGQQPYTPGLYRLSDASFKVNDFARPEVRRVVLEAIK